MSTSCKHGNVMSETARITVGAIKIGRTFALKIFYIFTFILILLVPVAFNTQIFKERKIYLEWDDTSDNEKGFCIEYMMNSSEIWTPLDSVERNVTEYGPISFAQLDTFHFRVYAYNDFGNSGYTNTISVIFDLSEEGTATTSENTKYNLLRDPEFEETGFEEESSLPNDFGLGPIYPNPFNPETTISYHLPKDGSIIISIFNLRGQKISQLVDDIKKHGNYEVIWHGRDMNNNIVGSNLYIVRMEAEGFVQTQKIIYMK